MVELFASRGYDCYYDCYVATVRNAGPDRALGDRDARGVVREVGVAVTAWREVAAALGLSAAACDRMTSAFEHDDLAAAFAA